PPKLMNDAEGGVAVTDRIGDDAHSQKIVNLIDRALLALRFLVDRIEPLDAAIHRGGQAVIDKGLPDGGLHAGQEFLKLFATCDHGIVQFGICGGLEITERQVLQVAANGSHSQAVRDGGINVERFTRDALLLFGREKSQGAHVVQPIGQLYQHDADVGDHGQEHFSNALRLTGFGGNQTGTADFGYAFDETGGLGAKAGGDFRERNAGVFDDVVEQSRRQGGDVQA